ncbi:hypothetical protein OAT71_01110 [Flavobacteriales bacterium]|nr:hypothetical protein [Flavobacteriales bacterium]
MIKKLLPFIALIVLLSSCEADRQNLILGRWNKIDVVSNAVPFYDTWSFDKSAYCFLIRETNGVQDTLTQGQYLIKNDILTITGEKYIAYYMGDWVINSLDKDQMTLILKANGLEYFEFAKED